LSEVIFIFLFTDIHLKFLFRIGLRQYIVTSLLIESLLAHSIMILMPPHGQNDGVVSAIFNQHAKKAGDMTELLSCKKR
jgi:hypothetical protein